jgi:hypothetical protein
MPDLAELSKRVTIGSAAQRALARLWAVGSFPSTAPMLLRRILGEGVQSSVCGGGQDPIPILRPIAA